MKRFVLNGIKHLSNSQFALDQRDTAVGNPMKFLNSKTILKAMFIFMFPRLHREKGQGPPSSPKVTLFGTLCSEGRESAPAHFIHFFIHTSSFFI